MDTSSAPRDALERLAAACDDGRLDLPLTRHGVEVLTAFGSAIDATVDIPHDLDVGVWCGGDGPADLPGLIRVLADAADHDVDLAILDTASVVLVSDAVTGRPLQEARPGLVAGLQMRAGAPVHAHRSGDRRPRRRHHARGCAAVHLRRRGVAARPASRVTAPATPARWRASSRASAT